MPSINRKIKISVSPSGRVKISDGLPIYSLESPKELNPLVNHSKVQDGLSRDEIREHVRGLSDEWLSVDSSDVPTDCRFWELPKAGRGSLGKKSKMSRKTSLNLAERMAAVELSFDAGIFATLTLPIESHPAYEALARQSSYAVNRISQWLRDNFDCEDFARCGVWEYQKRGALHYHLYLGVNDSFWDRFTANELSGKLIRNSQFPLDLMRHFRYRLGQVWESVLDSIASIYDIDMIDARHRGRILDYDELGKRFCNVQMVEKSVVSYLSKYLSDSNHGKDKNGLRARNFPIATWAQWDKKATQLYKDYSFSDSLEIDDYESFCELRDVLFACIEFAENTDILIAKNPFYESHCCISKDKGHRLLTVVREWFEDLKLLSEMRKSRHYLKLRNRRDDMINDGYQQIIRDIAIEKRIKAEECKKYCMENLQNIPLDLFSLVYFCDRIISEENANQPQQMELFK